MSWLWAKYSPSLGLTFPFCQMGRERIGPFLRIPEVLGGIVWNIRSMNQGKLEAVKQEMARVNIDI